MNHTPGPWTYTATAGNHDFIVYPDTPTGNRDIALVRDFNEGNARLIAKAPDFAELLEATDIALTNMLQLHEHKSLGDGPRAKIKITRDRIRRALAELEP